jgi:glycosyltransferase involved in cell wall biosynthesis
MRLAFVAHHGSIHTVRWVSFFAQRGHDVHVVTCGGGDGQPTGYTVHDLGRPRPKKLGYPNKISATRRVLRALRPDVVHAHYATSYGALALAAGVRPLIVTAHGDDVLVAPGRWLERRIVSTVLRHAALVTVPGEHMRAAVERLQGGPAPPVLVFQYGVEADRLLQLSDERRAVGEPLGKRPLRIVSARPLMSPYRVDALILGLGVLRVRAVDFTCDVIGGGPDRRRLEALADHLGLAGRVRFRGALDSAAVEEAMAAADIFVSLPVTDGASLALLEAMALGAVPVLSDIPANRQWALPGGAVLTAVDPNSVADAIEQAARIDRGRAARCNRQIVLERADLAVNLGRFEAIMLSLCGAPV